MPDNSFAHRFKRLEPVDLYAIIINAQDYQPEAVDAARGELQSRQLTEDQMNEVRVGYKQRTQVSDTKAEKWKEIKSKAETVAHQFSPVQFGSIPHNKYVTTITAFSCFYFLVLLYQRAWLLKTYFIGPGTLDFDSLAIDYFLPLVWLPIGLVLFAFKKKAGWVLLLALFVKNVLGNVVFLLASGLSLNLADSILAALIFGAACYAITRKYVMDVFKTNHTVMGNAIALGCAAVIIPWIIVYIN